jgi:hypothetical protein
MVLATAIEGQGHYITLWLAHIMSRLFLQYCNTVFDVNKTHELFFFKIILLLIKIIYMYFIKKYKLKLLYKIIT